MSAGPSESGRGAAALPSGRRSWPALSSELQVTVNGFGLAGLQPVGAYSAFGGFAAGLPVPACVASAVAAGFASPEVAAASSAVCPAPGAAAIT
jgi:hypothetical protein